MTPSTTVAGNIGPTTLLLAFCGGFCDTVTYVAGHGTFSAHVTGNFILFAYELVHHDDASSWLKLLTFPAFIVAVALGGRMAAKSPGGRILLLAEAWLLLLAGVADYLLAGSQVYDQIGIFGVIMLAVFAMGFQNAFGKLFAKATHGPTTMMTGNVTQAALDLGKWMRSGFADKPAKSSLVRALTAIGGFACGCLLGAVLARRTGLVALGLPAIPLLISLGRKTPPPVPA
jgi:uncharacterized membrane protein YoaK (UPF0700 family)